MSASDDRADAAGRPPTQKARSQRVLGFICFGGGLLVVAAGILLAVLGLVRGDLLLLVGILALVAGFVVNVWGLVLLYRSIVIPPGPTRPADDNEAEPIE
ncbi:hypothetical protein GCM10027416_18840 [Okibacterium endophyticum]